MKGKQNLWRHLITYLPAAGLFLLMWYKNAHYEASNSMIAIAILAIILMVYLLIICIVSGIRAGLNSASPFIVIGINVLFIALGGALFTQSIEGLFYGIAGGVITAVAYGFTALRLR